MYRRYYRINSQPNITRGTPKGLAVAELSEDGQNINFGFSFCSHKDHFSKERARKIAESRCKSGKFAVPISLVHCKNNIIASTLSDIDPEGKNIYLLQPQVRFVVDKVLKKVNKSMV